MGETRAGCIGWRGFVVVLLVAGCATARGAPPTSASVEATTDAGTPVAVVVPVPPRAPIVAAEPSGDPLARQGSTVFFRVCGPCHMALWRVPSGGTLSASERTEAAVRRQIREGSGDRGRGGMPAIGVDALPDHEMPALMAYLRTLHVVAPR
jgi:mono/diheme cytochrome c family protein